MFKLSAEVTKVLTNPIRTTLLEALESVRQACRTHQVRTGSLLSWSQFAHTIVPGNPDT